MSEWKTYKLNELIEIKYGKDHKHLNVGKIPVYGSGGIMRFVDKALYDHESILIPRKGTLSNLFYINKPFWSVDTMFYSKIKSTINGKFLYYYLKTLDLASMNVGSAVPSLTTELLNNIEVSIPLIEDQNRIASILSSLDDKIELNRQTNQTLEAIAQTLFQEMCVPKGEELPEGWRVGKLGEIYKTSSGGTPSRSKMDYYENGTINWVKSKELGNFYVLETEEKITETALKNSSAKLLPQNSILMAMYGATVAEISILGKPASCNQAICAILPNNKYPYSFVYEFLKNKREEIKSMAVGAAQQNISQVVIQGIEMSIPSNEVLSNFHKKVEPIYLQIKNNIEETQTLIALRDSLLPKLMKGEIEI